MRSIKLRYLCICETSGKRGHGFELWFANKRHGRGRAQSSKAIPTYLKDVSWNSAIPGTGKWLKLEISPSCEAGELYL